MFDRKSFLYRKYEGLSPIYKGWYTNHLPMMYTILEQLNIADDVREKVLDSYKRNKDLYSLSDQTYPVSSLEQEYVNRTGQFLQEINDKGIDVVVGSYVETITNALSCALYHGLIRLGYAVLSGDVLLVAQALAYYDVVRTDSTLDGDSCDVSEMSQKMDDLLSWRKEQSFDFGDMTTTDKFDHIVKQMQVDNKLFVIHHPENHTEEMLNLFLKQYNQTKSFYALHVITGFHALFLLEEYITKPDEVYYQFFLTAQVMLLLDVEEGTIEEQAPLAWDDMMPNIHLIGDAHRMKLLYSCHDLSKRFDSPLLRTIATYLYIG